MAFHKTNFGGFGGNLPCDMDGYVPEADDDDPWGFAIDHGGQATHDEDGDTTPYGEWWEEDGFPAWRDDAVQATRRARRALREWQEAE